MGSFKIEVDSRSVSNKKLLFVSFFSNGINGIHFHWYLKKMSELQRKMVGLKMKLIS